MAAKIYYVFKSNYYGESGRMEGRYTNKSVATRVRNKLARENKESSISYWVDFSWKEDTHPIPIY